MSDHNNETKQASNAQDKFPSLHALSCPKCGKNDFKVLGTKGAKGAAVGIGMAFGAIGNLVASATSKDNYELKPVQYKCKACGKKFDSYPSEAAPEEILDKPCTINFNRLSCFTGMAVAQNVWLNGIKVGSVNNGKSITFQTFTKHNTVFVTDQYGVVIKEDHKFEAQSGDTVELNFKRKFVKK